jgi:hypothetical protein
MSVLIWFCWRPQTALAAAMLTLAVLMSGCASHAKRVRCDGHLQPINAPAPMSRPAVAETPPVSKGKP